MDGLCGGSFVAALAGGFEKDGGSGGRDVERADAARHGNAEKVVAGAAHEVVQARALAAEDDDEITSEVELVVVGGAALIETGDPEVAALELFEGTNEIDDTRDAEVLGGSGAGLDCGGTERRGAALGEQHAVDAGAVGHAEKSTEILRIFDAVEGEDEARCGGAGGRLEEIFEDEEFLRTDEGDDTLVRGSFCGKSELVARLLEDTDACRAALSDEAFETGIAALAGDEDVVKAAAAGLQGFLDRMQAVENFHEFQCTVRDTKGAD